MAVLGIESSCDDLSMALVSGGRLLSQVTSSQVMAHRPFGGVVPEIASRKHLEALELTLEAVLSQAKLPLTALTGVSGTYAPGLVGSLLVGLNFAKGLAFSRQLPFRGVHHIEGHLLSPFLEHEVSFPFHGLVVSGGHSHLYRVEALGSYQLLGRTVDDAAGEAFDKVAKMMGLDYPGGPAIEQLARAGDPKRFTFALPRVKAHPGYTSFSGLKTAALEYWKQLGPDPSKQVCADLAASFQAAAVQSLLAMVSYARRDESRVPLVVAGGVACNGALREALKNYGEREGFSCLIPSPRFCTDNGAMIAWVGEAYLRRGEVSPLRLNAEARRPLGEEAASG